MINETVKNAIEQYVSGEIKSIGLEKIIEIAGIEDNDEYIKACDLHDVIRDKVDEGISFEITYDGESEWLYDDGSTIDSKDLYEDELIEDFELVKEEIKKGYPNISICEADVYDEIKDTIVKAVKREWCLTYTRDAGYCEPQLPEGTNEAVEGMVDKWLENSSVISLYDMDDDDISCEIKDMVNDMIFDAIDEKYPNINDTNKKEYFLDHYSSLEDKIKWWIDRKLVEMEKYSDAVIPELNDLQRYVDLITNIHNLFESTDNASSARFYLKQFSGEYLKDGVMGVGFLSKRDGNVIYRISWPDSAWNIPLLDLTLESLTTIYTTINQ